MGGWFPTNRPDINEQIGDSRNEENQERARQASIANAARPSWWKRLKAKFTRR